MQIKPVTLAITILIPLAATSPLARRDAATVVDDLNTISTDLDAFDQAVKNFQGGLTEALNIQAKESDLENDIKATTADTQDSAAFSDSGSSQVTNTLLDLEPDILNSLDLIVSKKSQVQQLGLSGLVTTDLKNLKKETDALSTALQAKTTDADSQTITSKTTDVDAAYESAINAFS